MIYFNMKYFPNFKPVPFEFFKAIYSLILMVDFLIELPIKLKVLYLLFLN